MKAKRGRTSEPEALELIEQAIHLLRQSPFSAWAAYYLGSLPFLLGLLYFWGDMSRDAAASQRLAEWPIVLSGLFVWMKCWQTVCTCQLMEQLQQNESEEWTWSRICRMVAAQSAIQPGALFLLPVALLLTVPFGWVYAFYENVSILGDGREDRLRQVWRRAWRQAGLWPMQNHWLIWLVSPYLLVLVAALLLVIVPWFQAQAPSWSLGMVWLAVSLLSLLMLALCPLSVAVALNLGAALILVPELMRMLLGIETQFTRSAWGMLNSTWMAMTCALTYLALDPLVKAVYVLRCCYGESRHSALDLRSELKGLRLRRIVPLVIIFMTIALSSPAVAQERPARPGNTATNSPTTPASRPLATNAADSLLAQSITPEQLDQSIEQVLAGREYRWRLPREQQPRAQESWLAGSFRNLTLKVRNWMRAFREWFDRLFRPLQPEPSGGPSKSSWLGSLQPLLLGCIFVLLLALAFLFWQRWRERRRKLVEAVGEAVASVPDLTQENVAANQLPEEGWLAIAGEFISQGEPRLALRALYFAGLANLEHCHLLTIARHKSNLDYLRELGRRAHAHPGLQPIFRENVAAFERVWYGFHEASLETVTLFRANLERIRALAR
ncbi:MAG: hypothetical protein L0387_35470 [Acidobacteria bacterium]|nr:hypothetical protein [Acidobacteriota bacterium]MCI0626890.1 hypothetical protein [Acidobacteriota bacterium]MCI0720223.1 hypothetical protein [Acidobacteriota bacterium]